MFKSITHISLMVQDQDKALEFFVDKLGFEKRDDTPMGSQRWLTVGCKGQPNLELILQAPEWGVGDLTAEERRSLIGKQEGFAFLSDNIEKDYKALQEKGVVTLAAPNKAPWGIQFRFKDLYGNVHLLVQPLSTP